MWVDSLFFKRKRASISYREQLWIKAPYNINFFYFFLYVLNVYFLCKSDIFWGLICDGRFRLSGPVSTSNNQRPCVFYSAIVLYNFLFSWTFDHLVCFVYPCCFVLFVFCFAFTSVHIVVPHSCFPVPSFTFTVENVI